MQVSSLYMQDIYIYVVRDVSDWCRVAVDVLFPPDNPLGFHKGLDRPDAGSSRLKLSISVRQKTKTPARHARPHLSQRCYPGTVR